MGEPPGQARHDGAAMQGPPERVAACGPMCEVPNTRPALFVYNQRSDATRAASRIRLSVVVSQLPVSTLALFGTPTIT